MNIIQDIEAGAKDIENFFESTPPSVQLQIAKLKTDGGILMQSLSIIAAKDITTGGILNTASYVTAAKDIFAQVVATGATVLLPDVFFILNAEVSALLTAPAVTPVAPVQPVDPTPPLAA